MRLFIFGANRFFVFEWKKRLLIIAMETVRRAALRSMLALMLACNSEANNTAPQSVFIDLQCPNGGDEAV